MIIHSVEFTLPLAVTTVENHCSNGGRSHGGSLRTGSLLTACSPAFLYHAVRAWPLRSTIKQGALQSCLQASVTVEAFPQLRASQACLVLCQVDRNRPTPGTLLHFELFENGTRAVHFVSGLFLYFSFICIYWMCGTIFSFPYLSV